ncbi:HNH endonuclease [Micromonospora phytophila]|uniref:YDG/SRA domain-containing protein n=1 Tax=Micromonospora phytophila TaxID=709888 RepID=UPI002030EECA|nr:YDG/SRA domain-containing protein [Micromonospora phytophila]MCM0673932.1 HNH endonuclease [Micromonospora phytophila]
MSVRTYGEIPGYPVGSTFLNRTQLAASKVHRPLQGGICGGRDGAESIVVSGGYIDDEDYGDEIVYTGQGGNDPGTKRQIAHQELALGNAGLARNQLEGNPVRVIRGAGGHPGFSPSKGFRYDGLFRVVDHWPAGGKDGFRIWRFRLVSLDNIDQPPTHEPSTQPAPRVPAVIQRLVRNTALALRVKQLYDYRCQICDTRLETPAGPYAEGAHVRPMGRPHNGPDALNNILCLCPNHHVLFDAGAIWIGEDLGVYETATGRQIGRVRMAADHGIAYGHLAYRASLCSGGI